MYIIGPHGAQPHNFLLSYKGTTPARGQEKERHIQRGVRKRRMSGERVRGGVTHCVCLHMRD